MSSVPEGSFCEFLLLRILCSCLTGSCCALWADDLGHVNKLHSCVDLDVHFFKEKWKFHKPLQDRAQSLILNWPQVVPGI